MISINEGFCREIEEKQPISTNNYIIIIRLSFGAVSHSSIKGEKR